MSPNPLPPVPECYRVPRASGDEPRGALEVRGGIRVFPARAGMSPTTRGDGNNTAGVPRASGDEPGRDVFWCPAWGCSPRERG